ncbi:hypothetical protein NUKP82_41390 [Klebsiella variicola]|nr:hypothetical protein NUKP82_41390 [Klebsiella variicola]
MTCSKLDDSAINGSGYAATTVRLEREAEVRICHDYPDAGLTSASDNQWRVGQGDQFPSYLYITDRRAYVFT